MDQKRKAILRFIDEFTRENGYPPSVAEITEGCGFTSTSVTQYHIVALTNSGHLSRQPKKARTLTVSHESEGT